METRSSNSTGLSLNRGQIIHMVVMVVFVIFLILVVSAAGRDPRATDGMHSTTPLLDLELGYVPLGDPLAHRSARHSAEMEALCAEDVGYKTFDAFISDSELSVGESEVPTSFGNENDSEWEEDNDTLEPASGSPCPHCLREGLSCLWPEYLPGMKRFNESTGKNSTIFFGKYREADSDIVCDAVVKVVLGSEAADRERRNYNLVRGVPGFVQPLEPCFFNCCFRHQERVGIIMEKAKGVNVRKLRGKLSAERILTLLFCLTGLLLNLYQSRSVCAHCDLKPDNLFWDEDSQSVTILDPGSVATKKDVELIETRLHLDRSILPPEYLRDGRRSPLLVDRIDSWHLGLLALNLLSPKLMPVHDEVRYAAKSLTQAREALQGAGLEVMVACLEENPSKRLHVDELHQRLLARFAIKSAVLFY